MSESREHPVHVTPEAIHPPSGAAAKRPDPCAVVIFGASGDLARRKLIPALYNLLADGLLPERLAVVGVARAGSQDEFVASLKAATSEHSRRPVEAGMLYGDAGVLLSERGTGQRRAESSLGGDHPAHSHCVELMAIARGSTCRASCSAPK